MLAHKKWSCEADVGGRFRTVSTKPDVQYLPPTQKKGKNKGMVPCLQK